MIEYLDMTRKKKKSIALIAHDGKKKDMLKWCEANKEILKNHKLSGTGTTAKLIADNVGLTIKGYNSGPLGGDQQIGAKIVEGSIDMMLSDASSGWRLNRIGKAELAILRIAVYEICYDEEVPTKVAINEAVELAKKYGSDASYSFVNGVLAKIVKK